MKKQLLFYVLMLFPVITNAIDISTKTVNNSYSQEINVYGKNYVYFPGNSTVYNGYTICGVEQTNLSWSGSYNTTFKYYLIPNAQADLVTYIYSNTEYNVGSMINGEEILARSCAFNLPYAPSSSSINQQTEVGYYFKPNGSVTTVSHFTSSTSYNSWDVNANCPDGAYCYCYAVAKGTPEESDDTQSLTLDEYIKKSRITNHPTENNAYSIEPTITKISKIYIDLTKYTTTRSRVTAIMILMVSYSARIVSSDVNTAGPANSGNASGTIDPEPSGPLFLNISTSSNISSAIRKRIIEPATAKARISTSKRFNTQSPRKKNTSINTYDHIVTLIGLIFTPLSSKPSTIGIEPSGSIMANSTMKALMI